MNQKGKISVIMGIYNCADTLPEAIESIVKQTYTNWQLIMCDDCSTDNTYDVAQSFVEQYPDRMILIRNEKNMHLAYSLNHCLEYADGEYVARMDSDDVSLPERFEKQVNYLRNHREYDLVDTEMSVFDGEKIAAIRKHNDDVPCVFDLKKGPCFFHATIMTYRSVYERLKGYQVLNRTERGQDYDLWFRFFHEGYKGKHIGEPLYVVTEDRNCYKRKKFKYRIGEAQTMFYGFRLNHFPLRDYVYVLKPIIAGCVPHFIMEYRHNNRKHN